MKPTLKTTLENIASIIMDAGWKRVELTSEEASQWAEAKLKQEIKKALESVVPEYQKFESLLGNDRKFATLAYKVAVEDMQDNINEYLGD